MTGKRSSKKCSRRPILYQCKIALFHFLGDKKQRSLLAFATFTRPPPRSAHGARPRHDIASTRQRTCDSFPHSSAAAMQSGNTTGSGLLPRTCVLPAAGEQRGGVLEQVGSSNAKTGEVGDEESDRRLSSPRAARTRARGTRTRTRRRSPPAPSRRPRCPRRRPPTAT